MGRTSLTTPPSIERRPTCGPDGAPVVVVERPTRLLRVVPRRIGPLARSPTGGVRSGAPSRRLAGPPRPELRQGLVEGLHFVVLVLDDGRLAGRGLSVMKSLMRQVAATISQAATRPLPSLVHRARRCPIAPFRVLTRAWPSPGPGHTAGKTYHAVYALRDASEVCSVPKKRLPAPPQRDTPPRAHPRLELTRRINLNLKLT